MGGVGEGGGRGHLLHVSSTLTVAPAACYLLRVEILLLPMF